MGMANTVASRIGSEVGWAAIPFFVVHVAWMHIHWTVSDGCAFRIGSRLVSAFSKRIESKCGFDLPRPGSDVGYQMNVFNFGDADAQVAIRD